MLAFAGFLDHGSVCDAEGGPLIVPANRLICLALQGAVLHDACNDTANGLLAPGR